MRAERDGVGTGEVERETWVRSYARPIARASTPEGMTRLVATVFHVVRRRGGGGFTELACDEVQRAIEAGADARGGEDFPVVVKTRGRVDGRGGSKRGEISEVFVMR